MVAWNLTRREFSITFQLLHLLRMVTRMKILLMMWSSSDVDTSYLLSKPRVQNALLVANKVLQEDALYGYNNAMLLFKQLGVPAN